MKRYKRVLSILLVCCMLVSLLPTVALATGTTPITGTCGSNLTWSLDTATGTFTVTGMGEMHDYFGEIERPWHNYRDSIKSIVISDGVTSVGRSAFRNCEELESVTLPNTIASIGTDSFYGCENLSGITLPDSVTSIGNNAFSFCAFESFIIPENVESIGAFAFESTNLTSITIPASVIYMGTNPFQQCFSLEEIIVDKNSSKYSSIDGVLFDKNKETLVIFPKGKGNRSLVYHIPDGVKTIASHAFYNCIFDSVEIPGSVTTISSSAFHQCIIDEITIPDGVTRIGADAFWNCTSLKRVNIADSVATIEAGAFDACYYLTDVYYAGSKEMWNNITIHEDNEPLTSAIIHYGNTDSENCYSAFINDLPTLPPDHAKIFLDFINDPRNPNPIEGIAKTKIYKLITGDLSDYESKDILQLKADLLTMTSFLKAQNASKIKKTFDTSQQAANAMINLAMTFLPEGGRISDADLGILSEYQKKLEDYVEQGIIDLINEKFFYGTYGGSIDQAISEIRDAMSYFNAIQSGTDKAQKILNGMMAAVYGLKYGADSMLASLYSYFNDYVSMRPYYDKDDDIFQIMIDAHMLALSENTIWTQWMLKLCGVPDWRDVIPYIDSWAEYICAVETYINDFDANTEQFSHAWDLSISKTYTNPDGTTKAVTEYICTTCGAHREEEAVGHTHSYSNDWKYDKTSHWHECTCGDKADVAAHTPGAVATETTPQTCTECGYILAPATGHIHSYSNDWKYDETSHWHGCTCGDKADIAAHTPGAAATETTPQTCTECGYILAPATGHIHSYSNDWKYDETNHWHGCTCGDKADVAAHTPGAAATETTPQTCTECGYILVPATGHIHSHSNDWKYDETNHWHECTCGDKVDVAAHTPGAVATETTPQTCTECGYILAPATGHIHSYSNDWKYNETNHWHGCTCGDKADVAAHTPGAVATETTPQTCTECGYILAPATGHIHSYSNDWKYDETNHWHGCTCGDKADVAIHTLSNWIIDQIATSTQNGYRHRECTICTYVLERDTIPITNNNSGNETGNANGESDKVPSGSDKIEITNNPDGTTTKTESKVDGTIVETTEKLDGSTIIVEKKPDGTKVEILTHANGSRIETIIQPNGFSQTIMDRSDGSSSTTVSESGQMSTQVMISGSVASEGILEGEAVALPMPQVSADTNWKTAPTITINIPIETAIKAEIPVENISPSVVAVIIKSDGTEEIMKSSIFTEDSIVVTLKNGDKIKVVDNSKSFSDVPLTYWGIDAVDFVSSREIFIGTSDSIFTPEGTMNRGMIATVLYRLENTPTLTDIISFSDVGGDEWYADAIQWAAENNIMSGYGNNQFGPMDSVTREQLAVILYNYTASKGISIEAAGDLSVFHDAEDTSDWAEEAISWAVGVGLLSGKGNGILDPTGTTTRAEVAQILMNYCMKVA